MIKTIYNFIDIDYFKRNSSRKLPSDVLSYLDGNEYMLNVGRLIWEKNQKSLIRQFSYYFKHYNNKQKLLIIGSGPLEEELNNEIKLMNSEKFIKIIPFTKEIGTFYQYAKAYLMTSISEGLPNVISEAMCYGIPIICTDCYSGPRELLNDENSYDMETKGFRVSKRGILVQHDIYNRLSYTHFFADAMNYMFKNELQLKMMANNSKRYMQEYNNHIIYEWEQVIQVKKGICNSLVEEETKYEQALRNSSIVIIYGAGKVGKRVAKELEGKYNICYAVSKGAAIKETGDIPTYYIDQLTQYKNSGVVLIATEIGEYICQMMNTVRRIGYVNYFLARW